MCRGSTSFLQAGLNPFALAANKQNQNEKPASSFEKVMDLVVRAPEQSNRHILYAALFPVTQRA